MNFNLSFTSKEWPRLSVVLSALLSILLNATFYAVSLGVSVQLAIRKPVLYGVIALLWLVVSRLLAEYAYDAARKAHQEGAPLLDGNLQIDWDQKPTVTVNDVLVSSLWPAAIGFNVIIFVLVFVAAAVRRLGQRSS